MKPTTLEAIEAARDGALLLLNEEESFIALSIEGHLRCVADYLKRRPLIEAARSLLDLDPAGKEAWHYTMDEVGTGPIVLRFFSLPNASALASVLRVAAQAGYRRKEAVEINRELLTVTWKLHDLLGIHRFTIIGSLDSSKVACKQVQVGTKEVPVYEVHCDQASEEEFAKLNEAL